MNQDDHLLKSYKDIEVRYLAELLEEAEEAHGTYEDMTGETDPNWSEWYAEFIIDRLNEKDE